MADAWWNMFYQLQHENLILNEKYNELYKLFGEMLEAIKSDAKQRMNKKRETSKIRCKYQNKGYCKEGSQCDYFHPEEPCHEQSLSGVCSKEKTCPSRHPNKCKFWIRGHCWRGNTCIYLHRPEDLETEVIDNDKPADEATDEFDENLNYNENEDGEENGEENDEESEHAQDQLDHQIDDTIDLSTNAQHEITRGITVDEILAMYESDNDKVGPVQKSSKKKKNKKIH